MSSYLGGTTLGLSAENRDDEARQRAELWAKFNGSTLLYAGEEIGLTA